jgi:hypothetical protein
MKYSNKLSSNFGKIALIIFVLLIFSAITGFNKFLINNIENTNNISIIILCAIALIVSFALFGAF